MARPKDARSGCFNGLSRRPNLIEIPPENVRLQPIMSETMKRRKEIKFEDALKRLDEIVTKLEDGDLELEKSIELFEEGIVMAKNCQKKLDEADSRIEKLTRDSNGNLATQPLKESDSAPS